MKKRLNVLLALSWYHPKIHRGVARYAREHHWHLHSEISMTRSLPVGWDGDGIICQLQIKNELNTFLKSLSQPKICINHNKLQDITTVSDDNDSIANMAANHYLERGFRNFAIYQRNNHNINRRLITFKNRVNNAGFECLNLALPYSKNRQQQLKWLTKKLQNAPAPLAIFAPHDNSAVDIIEICIDQNIPIPTKVAILGVRNDTLICDTLGIPLSSIENNLEQVGYTAAKQLDLLIANPKLPTQQIIIPPAQVIIRQSTDIIAVDHPQISKVILYIHKHFRQQITTQMLLKKCSLSERGLYKAFKQALGSSPHQEIIRLRIDEAKRMLIETQEKVTTIAEECGFNDSRNLFTMFKERLKISPRKFRDKYQKNS